MESPGGGKEAEAVDIMEDLDGFTDEALYNNQWVKTWDTEINSSLPEEIRISLSLIVKGRTFTVFDSAQPKIGMQA